MKGNMGQPIDHSLETLLNAGNYRDRIRFITVPRTKGVKERTDFEGAKWEVFCPKPLWIAVPQVTSLPDN